MSNYWLERRAGKEEAKKYIHDGPIAIPKWVVSATGGRWEVFYKDFVGLDLGKDKEEDE